MTDWTLQLLAQYGAPLLGLVTLASCLALPVPASLVMLTAGAFAASGDLALPYVTLAAFVGAVLGDQIGFFIGRSGQSRLYSLIERFPKRASILAKATALLRRRGAIGVFLSRWLFSPLGPYVNFAAGAAGLRWARFTLWGILGETVWVSLYVGLGYGFSHNLGAVALFARDISGLLAGLVLMTATGLWLRRVLREHQQKEKSHV